MFLFINIFFAKTIGKEEEVGELLCIGRKRAYMLFSNEPFFAHPVAKSGFEPLIYGLWTRRVFQLPYFASIFSALEYLFYYVC